MPKPSTVSEITRYIKNLFMRDYVLTRAFVQGEISNCSYHRSGHIYFTLKDSGAELSCVMFAGERGGLKFRLDNGQQVEVRGRIGIYEKAGRYQLYAEEIGLSGEGELFRRYLELKQRLEDMGMFDELYKKPLPPYASRIGIVTAIGGAALQDIINVSKRRNPYVKLVLYPAAVQGEGAAQTIARGIRTLDALGLDVIIVGRGGGSIEDLWAFNEEIVAQAIFEAGTPIVSAVGHETDYTIADFVADVRAATPSAAAEITNFVYAELEEELSARRDALRSALDRRIRDRRHTLELYGARLKLSHPGEVLRRKKEGLDDINERMRRALTQRLKDVRQREAIAAARLHALSPLKKISGGFAYVTDGGGRALRSAGDAAVGDQLRAVLSDGCIEALVTDVRKNGDSDEYG